MFFSLLKVFTDTLQNGKHHLLHVNRSDYNVILSESQKGLEPVSSLYDRARSKLEIFVQCCTNICRNFLLRLSYDGVIDFEVIQFNKNTKI